ncbi:MAG: hypothetical protein JXR88_02230 [Clostridia bacterium]|nr:hypothetical protein [Clostridia bacterium]
MPREAREKKLYSYYYIEQKCEKSLVIFRTKKHRMMFLETLKKVKEKYNFKLYGVSVHRSGFEMILYDNGSDISKIMKSLNISIAMQYKCDDPECGVVFKERYKSEMITPATVSDRIKKLPLCVYMSKDLLDTFLVEEIPVKQCIDCVDKAEEKLKEILEAEGMTFEEMLKNKSFRNELIKDFRKTSVLSLAQLGELFGQISESGVSKILSR